MPKNLKVSIIIPTYNQAKLLEKGLQSSLDQTYENLEIVVLDDNSNDDTEQIVSKYLSSNKVKYHKNAINLGRVKNYFKGVHEIATGDFCLVLDGDDYLIENEFIEKAVLTIIGNSPESILFFQAKHIKKFIRSKDDFGQDTKSSWNFQKIKASTYLLHFRRQGFSHLTTLFNRNFAITSGFYTLDILSTDIHSFLKLCINYPNYYVLKCDKVVGVWYKHQNNASSEANFKKLWPSLKMYFNLAERKDAQLLGLGKIWALKQIIKPILSIILRKFKLLKN